MILKFRNRKVEVGSIISDAHRDEFYVEDAQFIDGAEEELNEEELDALAVEHAAYLWEHLQEQYAAEAYDHAKDRLKYGD